MARFKKMVIAGTSAVDDYQPAVVDGGDLSSGSAFAVAKAAVKELPGLPLAEADRLARLLGQRVTASSPEVARAAIEAAAALRCQVPYSTDGQDRKTVGHIARFLVWSAFGDVVDPYRAFTKANVDEYLAATATESRRSLDQRRYILYGTGRRLHPQQFPAALQPNTPQRSVRPVASHSEIRRLQMIVPRLPALLGQRTQALLDLCYGAGTRPADLRRLRGTAISSVDFDGRAITVVTLPNLGGGVRQVPVVDPAIGARLLGLAATIGDRLLLAPHARVAERNIVNRVSEQLRHHGHAGLDPVALRNRWVLDTAERVPAVLLQQLADLCELRILVEERAQTRRYKLRHAITILTEAHR